MDNGFIIGAESFERDEKENALLMKCMKNLLQRFNFNPVLDAIGKGPTDYTYERVYVVPTLMSLLSVDLEFLQSVCLSLGQEYWVQIKEGVAYKMTQTLEIRMGNWCAYRATNPPTTGEPFTFIPERLVLFHTR